MRLSDDELVFHDFRWHFQLASKSVQDVQYVSPFFDLDVSPHCLNANNLRFAVRLKKSEDNQHIQIVHYLYVHHLDVIGVGLTDVECSFLDNKQSKMAVRFRDDRTLIFETVSIPIEINSFTNRSIDINYRIYPTNSSSGYTMDGRIIDDYGFERIDVDFGRQMWRSAKKRRFTDCEFLVGCRILPAHRSVIAARCPKLIRNWTDVDQDRSTITVLDNHDIFESFLYFVYTGQVMADACGSDPELYGRLVQLIVYYVGGRNGHTAALPPLEMDVPSLDIASTVIINENYGHVERIRRGISVEFQYESSYKWGENPPARKIHIPDRGSFEIKLKPLDLVGGNSAEQSWNRLSIRVKESSAGLALSDAGVYDGGRKLPLVLSRYGSWRMNLVLNKNPVKPDDPALPHQPKLPKKSLRDRYLLTANVELALEEVCPSFSYRLRDRILSADYWSIYTNKTDADVQLRLRTTDTIVFTAHKFVLSARSAVFDRHFGADDDGGGCCWIDGTDDPLVFEEFLHFVYTGALRSADCVDRMAGLAAIYRIDTLQSIAIQLDG